MPKVNLLSLPPVVRPEETRTFTDPAQPGVELSLTFRRISIWEMSVATENARELVKLGGLPAAGEVVLLTEQFCQTLCTLEAMQCGPEDERYTAQEFVGLFAGMPKAGEQVLAWAGELNSDEDPDEGNASRAA